MIKGIGVDIVEIQRIKEAVEKHGDGFLERVYTAKEINYCKSQKAWRYPELAVRFAAKEAYSKAVGTGITGFARNNRGMHWKAIEVRNNSRGKPQIYLKGKPVPEVQVSLSHCRDFAVAMVVIG
ncbi:holo-ACP synthase [Candidatus Saganbacteria bacterium]|uniref:Holo-[acyl-carrier-protein] synthase n=1 Tax=Candidatus Saganbacteria bacterium TaxID=2575572 RepID=A0A9D6YSY9_UNCSA|nr:holo-ACP synthase [Candidatus Saganbacteria bacterium]